MTADVVAVGAGPFNLALAALADGVPGLRVVVLEQQPEFRWHPGLLIEGATVQVPFLADLVTLVEPTSRWSFLSYLRAHGRLFPFYFAERFHVARAEYEAYCRWVAEGLGVCRFGERVTSVAVDQDGLFLVNGLRTRHLVLGVGTEPVLPEPLRGLPGVLHSADYLAHRAALLGTPHVTVVGSGQSGAEVFLDLLRRGHPGLRWLSRTPAFAPMEYSKLGLEQFTPDYTAFFRTLPAAVRDRLVPAQWQLYKGVSAETLGAIHDELYERSLAGGWPAPALHPGVAVTGAAVADGRLALSVRHVQQGTAGTLLTDAVVAATGYAERPLAGVLGPLAAAVATDDRGRPQVDEAYRLTLHRPAAGSVFVQNAERHTHGVGAPDLGLAAWRAAVIVNAVCGRAAYPLPDRTAFTTFGLGEEAT
ncbi:MAG TPA: SidA/IucD/PvdA family monooxygenase [Pseudonocardiaceae bacterium]